MTQNPKILNTLRDSSVYIINCVSQPAAQELDKIHVYMHARFVDLLQKSVF